MQGKSNKVIATTLNMGVPTVKNQITVVLKALKVTSGAVAGVVGIEGGVVSGVINLESSGVGASDWRPRHEKHYQEV